MVYIVRSGGELLDARLIVGLSSTQITEALDTVLNPLVSSMKYSDLQYTGSFESIFVYEHRFTLDFTSEVKVTDYNDFVNIIQQQFVAAGVFTAVDQLFVSVVKLEEVFDARGSVRSRDAADVACACLKKMFSLFARLT